VSGSRTAIDAERAVALIVVVLISLMPSSGSLFLPWVDLSGPVPAN
jgi:hypothetical protein